MKNRDVYERDPDAISLLNNGVAAMTDAATDDERRTLRFELEHFVCEGQYRSGLIRILESYLGRQGQPEQPAAWISGFFGSGKSHLAKMLRFLWTDYTFPGDGASARGLARLPSDVAELFREVSTLGRRGDGLHAAAGTLGAGAGGSVRLSLLGIVFKSAGLPESFPQARFSLWLRKNGIYEQVRAEVEAAGRVLRSELSDLYVSPVIARALLAVDPGFAAGEKEARAALRAQFPKPDDITTEEFVDALQDALAPGGAMPGTVIILDEVQQYIGDDTSRSYVVQEIVEACSKRFGDRLLFVGTGQTALSGTPALQRLQGRFTVNVELSDYDVETVIRRVVLAKRSDRRNDIQSVLEANTGEIDRHLRSTRIAPRPDDKSDLVDDYPLLPVRRRFWEHTLRAVDRAGTAGQLRTQLRIVYDAIRRTADQPVGTVVPADFLFEEISANLLQSGVLLREIHEGIVNQGADGTPDGALKSRICALVFLIRKLPREPGADIGVRATTETLADLMVEDLATDGASLRSRLSALLDALVEASTLMKLDDDEYSLQTREGIDWDAEFRNRTSRIANDAASMAEKRASLLGAAVQAAIASVKLLQGACKEPRKLTPHLSPDPPSDGGNDVPVWIRDGWGTSESSALDDARAAGMDSPILHVFVPKSRADAFDRLIATRSAASETLDYKGVSSTLEGIEARQGMETRQVEADSQLRALVADIVNGAKVFQGGGNERLESTLADKVREAAAASLVRLFDQFGEADDSRWSKVIERARRGADHPLEVLDYSGKTEEHRVCSAVLSFVGAGKKGREVRSHFSAPPFGWPRDAIDAALISLFGSGHLRAAVNGVAVPPRQLDQAKVPTVDFRIEHATVDAKQRLKLRKLFQDTGVDCKPNEESEAAGRMLKLLAELARYAGGDAPLPEHPDTGHLTELGTMAGNEQLLAILERHDQLAANFEEWSKARKLAAERLPAFERLRALARHAHGLEVAGEVEPQIDAIFKERRLLDASDPVPGLATKLTDALRNGLAESQERYDESWDGELQRLDEAESWRQSGPEDRERIFARFQIKQASKGATGTEQQVLESLGRISLDGWRMRTAALSKQFSDARAEADRLVEPKIRHVKLPSVTLRTVADVKAWTETTERDLLGQIQQGPIAIG